MAYLINIIVIGKKSALLQEETDRLLKLIRPYAKVSIRNLKNNLSKNANSTLIVERESKLLLKAVPANSLKIALSPEGTQSSSESFASWLSKMQSHKSSMNFLIGGAYGLSESMKKECDDLISLSQLTFSHKLCQIVLLEQIYRAFTILNNHPYHKE